MDPTVERYNGLRAKAVVLNRDGSCVVRIRSVWSEYLGVMLVIVMCYFTIYAFMAAFMNPFGRWNLFEWSMIVFAAALGGVCVWGQMRRVMTIEITASREGVVVRRSILGVPRTVKIKNGVFENVRWHAQKDLSGCPWESCLQVALPNGKEMMLARELSVMDECFAGNMMAALAKVTGWKSEVKRIHMEPPDMSGST